MVEVEGGWIIPAITIAGALIYLYNEGDDFIKGVKEGFDSIVN
ncbi:MULTISPECIES: lactobin A/cerein 7B family class IIb bacteriocin [Sphingobacterium]|nr:MULTISPECIES: lactobin A/cerein 7B family class IIb bacteriocin [unclassified Sphingobacterium]